MERRCFIRRCVAVSAAALTNCGADIARLAAAEDATVIETFEIAGNGDLLLVPVTVAGREHKFVLDTGCSFSTIDVSLRGSLVPTGESRTADWGQRIDLFTLTKASVGKAKLPLPTEVQGFDLADFRTVSGHDIRGFVGMDFLRDYVLRIDFDAGHLSFLKNSRGVTGTRVPIEFYTDGIPVVAAAVAGAGEQLFQIDTGESGLVADGSLESHAFDQAAAAGQLKTTSGTRRLFRLSGVERVREGVASKFETAGLVHSNLVFDEREPSTLGLGYLRRFTVTFDFPNRQVLLARGAGFDRVEAGGPGIGAAVLAVGSRRVLRHVEKGGIADECGLRDGDQIVAVDGRSARELTLHELRRHLVNPKDGTVLVVVAKRDGRAHAVRLRLRP